MLMALGQFVFHLPTLAYHELRRASEWRHPGNSRVGAREALQFIGPGEDTITLAGVLVPEIAGLATSLTTLRAMADAGDTYALVDGIGRILGAWVITHIDEGHTALTPEGLPRRIEFTIALKRSDDALVQSDPPGNAPRVGSNSIGTIDGGGNYGSYA
jgi:phage protein U